MFTEDELIDAMQHSAHRADEPAVATRPSRPSRSWSRYALPAAAAAVVLALATGAVLLGRDDSNTAPAAGPTSAVSARPSSTPPTSAAATSSPAAAAHVPVDLSAIIDHVQVGTSKLVNWELGGNGDVAHGSSEVELPLTDPDKVLTLDIVGRDSGLDARRIPRDHPVKIAGTTGYYSSLKLFPLDADTGPGSDKYLNHWTIAFRTPAGDWAFVHIEKATSGQASGADDVSVADPAAIVAAYDKLQARFGAGRSTLPFRTGYLPAGLTANQIFFATGEPGLTGVYLTAGRKTIDLQLAPVNTRSSIGSVSCLHPCGLASATVGGFRVAVIATGYDAATARRIVHTLTVTKKPGDPNTYWPLADALG